MKYRFTLDQDRLLVPYLCEDYEDCDQNNFWEYPLQHGFDVEESIRS
jgi:hypothetical protein